MDRGFGTMTDMIGVSERIYVRTARRGRVLGGLVIEIKIHCCVLGEVIVETAVLICEVMTMEAEKINQAICDALDYNGLTWVVKNWAKIDPDVCVLENGDSYRQIACPEYYGQDEEERTLDDYYQLQFVWMIGVLMFGDYGASPRHGWIEDVDGFRAWIKRITEPADA